MNDAMNSEVTLTLKIEGRYGLTLERQLVSVEFETEESFFDRAKKLLAKMREELP